MNYQSGSKWIVAACAVTLLAGCAGANEALGVGKRPPDEFTVVSNPALVIPPDYRLRPPDAANPRPEAVDSETLAIGALFPGRKDVPPPPSPGEQSLLKKAGAQTADASVRSGVTDDVDKVANKGKLTMDILKSGVVQEGNAKIVRLEPRSAQ